MIQRHRSQIFCKLGVLEFFLDSHLRKTAPRFTCSKSTIKTPEQWRHWRRSSVFIVNFKLCSGVSIVDFKQGNAGWEPRFYSLIELFSIFPFIFFVLFLNVIMVARDWREWREWREFYRKKNQLIESCFKLIWTCEHQIWCDSLWFQKFDRALAAQMFGLLIQRKIFQKKDLELVSAAHFVFYFFRYWDILSSRFSTT